MWSFEEVFNVTRSEPADSGSELVQTSAKSTDGINNCTKPEVLAAADIIAAALEFKPAAKACNKPKAAAKPKGKPKAEAKASPKAATKIDVKKK